MENNASSLFQIGDNHQSNTIIINAQIDTLVKRIKKDFSGGNFAQAFNDLDSAFSENADNIKVKYQLLLVKLKFSIDCRRFNDANELIGFLESDYSELNNDLKFKELKLTMMSLNNDDNYLTFANSLRLETPNSLPKGHFEILYYLNTKQFDKAKEVFEEEIKNDTYKHKLYLVGGHLYSNEYRYFDVASDNYDKVDYFYQLAIEHSKLDFLEKLQINGFYATYFMNNQLRNKTDTDDNLKEKLIEYKTSLNIVLNNKKYFEKSYLDVLIDNYLFSLISLGETEEYILFYESNSDDSNMRHYLTYCNFKSFNIDHKKCQDYILKKGSLDNTLVYISLILDTQDEDRKVVLEFFNQNKELIYKDKFTVLVYIKGLIQFNTEIDEELIEFVTNNKYENLEYILAYFEVSLYLGIKITDEDKNELFKKAEAEDLTLMRVYQAVEMLYKVKAQEEYLKLVIKKQNIFNSLLPKVLEDICYNDKDLLLPNYNEFVEQIVNPKLYAGIIGNIYSQHDDLNTAFKYFHIEFKERKEINVAITILHLSQVYYHRFYKNINIVKQSEVFNFVLGRLDELEINLLIALFGYSVIINKDTSSVFPTINQYLLKEDIKEINNDIKIRFSDIHIHTMSFVKDLYEKTILIDTNLCLEKDGKTYIKDMYEINDENIKNYGFLTISEDDYNLRKQNEDYTEGSLLHRITGVFAYRCDNPNMFMIDVKNDFSELFKMMEEHKQLKIKTFEDFNNGNIVTFYNLAEKDYKKYFTLIPKLLNDENYNLDSGQYNYLSNETPKILTFSSIILLNEINYLEEVLKKEEIFIQRTLMRFLISYKESLEENSSEIPKFNSINCQFTFFLETEYFTEKERIILLINRLIKYERIIEDDKEVLPIKESATRITENFGVQEYHALAYSHKNNYQIITEDRTFVHLFQGFNFNPIMVSNSISLIKDVLSIDDFNNLKIDLHKKKYKNLIEDNYLTILKKFMFFNNIDKISESERKFLKLIIEDYEAIDDLKKFGEIFDLKHFLSNVPTKTLYDINFEKLLKPKK